MKASELKKYLEELIEAKGDMDVQVMSIYHEDFVNLNRPRVVYFGFTPKLRLG
jgi:hypothetical protein